MRTFASGVRAVGGFSSVRCIPRVLLRLAVTSVMVSFLSLLTGAAAATDENLNPTYRTTVEEVRLTFFSWDETGRASRGLKTSDFVVVDNSLVVRKFRSFTPIEPPSLEAIILVDASQSVAGRFQAEVDELMQFMDRARWIGDNNASVMEFGSTWPKVVCAGHCRSQMSWTRLLQIPPGPVTPLYDAVVMAAGLAAHHHAANIRPVLILFSDGVDTISLRSVVDAIDMAIANDVQIYTVDLNFPRRSRGSRVLRRLADETGGAYIPPEADALSLLADLPNYLRAGYTVIYQPPSRAPGFHSVRIEPAVNVNLRFACRNGYYYQKSIAHDRGLP